MKKFVFIALILPLFLACSKDNQPDPPANFTVSKGTAVGVIRIDFQLDDGVSGVQVERRELGSQTWVTITATPGPFDDQHGFAFGLPPGKKYEYRIKNDSPDEVTYSKVDTGWAYAFKAIDTINFSRTASTVSLSWNKGNINSFLNDSDLFFDVYRSTDSVNNFTMLATVDEARSYFDDLTGQPSLQNIPLYYRVDIRYEYRTLSAVSPSGGAESTGEEGVVNRVDP
jgi:hypothetical protein